MATNWKPITANDPPEGQIVMTKIDDERGERNEQALKRKGRLWFLTDGSMYVYYTPTHWRPAEVRVKTEVTYD